MVAPLGSTGFAFVAGALSTLSPCVLPILPLVLAPAAGAHRLGPAALGAGLVTSFVTIGLFVATAGFAIGLDGGVFRVASAVILGLIGIVLLSSTLQTRFAVATGGMSNAVNGMLDRMQLSGLAGQYVAGLLLGAVWSPCAGPTLGAASVMAAQGRNLASVAIVMAAFGLGAAIPLLLIGSLSRQALNRWRGRLMEAGKAGKIVLGAGAVAVAAVILSGVDRIVEEKLVAASPAWLVNLTTSF
jgi:cytochrome c biogenesis protein CcdA